jgi:hypothetical protein
MGDAAKEGEECKALMRGLLDRLRVDLGLPASDARRQVFFRDPTGTSPEPDDRGEALKTELYDHVIRLDVEIVAPDGRDRYILYIILKIREYDQTQYRITFEATDGADRIVMINRADPDTYAQFSHQVIDGLLEYFNTDCVGTDSKYVRSPIGFSHQ